MTRAVLSRELIQSRPQASHQTRAGGAGLCRGQQASHQIDGEREDQRGQRRKAGALVLYQVVVCNQEHAPAETEERPEAQRGLPEDGDEVFDI